MLKFKQLNEISQGLRDKYVAKATAAHGHYNMARRNTTGADQQYFARKEKNTQKGISRALDDKRLNKESSDMCNVCGQTPCNCTSIDEGILSKIANKVMGAQPEKPVYKTGQKVEFQTTMHQPNWKGGGSGTGTITDTEGYTRHGHYLVKTNHGETHAISHHDITKVIKEAAKDDMRTTVIKRAIAKAQRKAPVIEGANVRAGNPKAYGRDLAASETGFGKKPREDDEYHNEPKPKFKAKSLMDRPHDVHIDGKKWKSFNTGHQAHAAANTLQSKGKKAVAIARFNEEMVNPYIQEGLVDESSDKLYAGYQADVLSLKAKAAAQEKKHPVDIQKLAARLKAADTKSQGTK
jgi:hypothetical protein